MIAAFRRLVDWLRARTLEDEFQEELSHHLELLEAQHRARGLSPDAARLAARRDLGGVARVREAQRRQRTLPWLDVLGRDLRLSLRSLRRTPAATASIIMTLAIGLGATTGIFAVIDAVLITPLPYPGAHRLVSVSHAAPGVDIDDLGSAPFLFFVERDANRTLEGLGLWEIGSATLTGRGEPEDVRRLLTTADVLPLLAARPALGRVFSRREDVPDSTPTVILSHGFWQRRFGGDAAIVGQRVTLDGQPRDVVGVMPDSFRFLDLEVDVIYPYRLNRNDARVGNYFGSAIGRLKPGVTLEQASADIARAIPTAIDSFPFRAGTTRADVERMRLQPRVRPLKDEVVGDASATLWVLMGMVGLVLLIACANVANLVLVRTEDRQQELAIRAALGASRGRIALQLLTESVVLTAAGAALAVFLAAAALPLLAALEADFVPRARSITVDGQVLLFVVALSVVVAAVFGLLPLARSWRDGVAQRIAAGARLAGPSPGQARIRWLLVTVQVAFAFVLLTGAGLMIRTYQQLNRVDHGFGRLDHVQTIRIEIPRLTERDPERVARLHMAIRDRLAAGRGVTAVAFTSTLPLQPSNAADLLFLEGRPDALGSTRRQFKFISPGLFAAIGTPIVVGRDLTWDDVYDRRAVVMVSENVARAAWGSAAAALGKRVRSSSPKDDWREIVGVVRDVHDNGLEKAASQVVYLPVLAERIFNNPILVAHGVGYVITSERAGEAGFLEEIRQAVWAVHPDLPIASAGTLADIFGGSLARTAFALITLTASGTFALLLGVIGIYGVVSHAVSRRTREIGIRVAMGASVQGVTGMFIRRGVAATLIGLAAGLGATGVLTPWLTSMLFEVRVLDPATLVMACGVLLAASVAASYVPARRAAAVDPLAALRSE